jgi:hypothetical protein
MLQPEPRLLKFINLTEQTPAQDKTQLSPAMQALVIYALIAGHEHEAQETPAACTALTIRRKQGIFSIRTGGHRLG